MRCISTFTVLAIPIFFGFYGHSCAAAAVQDANPPGPYQQTCTDISVKNGTLYAKCQNEKGKTHSAKLSNYQKCSAPIVNKNGSLICAMSEVLPPGSYLATCKDIRVQGTTLNATCNNGKDQWLPAKMRDVNKCTGDIANQKGTLRCTEIKRVERR